MHQQDAHRKNKRHHRIEQDGKGNHPVLVGVATFQGECLVCLYLGVKLAERADTLPENLDHGHSTYILHGGCAHLFLCIVINGHELSCPFPHEVGELQEKANHHDHQTDHCQPYIQREKDDQHYHYRCHYIDQIRNGMGDEALYFLDILVHCFLDGSRRGIVQISQRQFANMFRQTDTQPIQDTECSHM